MIINPLYIIALVIFSLIAVSIIWRFLSQHQSIPCPAWLSFLIEMDNPFAKTHHAKNIIQNSGIRPGMTILDAGCGPGRVSIPAAIQVGPRGQVVAMDIQSDMLKRTQKRAEANGLNNIEYLQAGLGEGKLGSKQFDIALLITVLGEIPNQEAALKELYKALKPGGILSITELIFDPHFQRLGRVCQFSKQIGFQEKEVFGKWFSYTINLKKPE